MESGPCQSAPPEPEDTLESRESQFRTFLNGSTAEQRRHNGICCPDEHRPLAPHSTTSGASPVPAKLEQSRRLPDPLLMLIYAHWEIKIGRASCRERL